MHYKSIFVLTLLFSACISQAQLWQELPSSDISYADQYTTVPSKFSIFRLDNELMKSLLWDCPHEDNRNEGKSQIITFPLSDGSMDEFEVWEYYIMEEKLSAKYPDIKTFHGQSRSNPYRKIRIDYTDRGVRAVISENYSKTYIEHLNRNDKSLRLVFNRLDFPRKNKWTCEFDEREHGSHVHTDKNNRNLRAGDCQFRTYRLAQATTGEYSNYHGAFNQSQSSLVMSAVTTTINRINEVYEQDITVRLILINNTDTLFFYNPNTDPYTNNNGSQMLGQNQTTCDARIGNPNYDIGHVFSTGGGGVANLNAVCNNSIKAGGVTGSSQPEGDPFDIDYVAHEVGHQFGANHTQNNNCNRSNNTAMEPGSASTIMGYAGICNPNVQNNSDPYFHAISIQEMTNRILNTNCHTTISFPNNPPLLAPLQNYNIPVSTPFVLTADATDPDGDALLYCWEQMDNQVGQMPPQSTNTAGPIFRSIVPQISPSRYFPPITNVLNNSSNTWQVLPSVARNMNFRITVRDLPNIVGNVGCTTERNVTVSTIGNAGPFVINTHNTPDTWFEGENINIEWDVANTDQAPINCSHVDILLSYDGGNNFSTVLASNVPNIGSAIITIPIGTSSQARYMVKGVGNIFYDINNANITIEPGGETFLMSITPTVINECNTFPVTFQLNTISLQGYNGDVQFFASDLPPNAVGVFNPPLIQAGQSSTLTITNLNGNTGAFNITIRGVSGSIVRQQVITVNLFTPNQSVQLSSPANNASNIPLIATLIWQNINSPQYEYQVSKNQNFTKIVYSGIISDFSFTTPDFLIGDAVYYWRVRPVVPCESDNWSQIRQFTTQKCGVNFANDLPIPISASGTPTINSYFTTSDRGTMTDVDVVRLQGRHTWINDLDFSLFRPGNDNARVIMSRSCNDEDDFNINLDDAAPPGGWPCPPNDGRTYRPSNTLAWFNNNQLNGQWRLRVRDNVNQDGGFLDSWGLKICANNYCRTNVDHIYKDGIGSLPAAVACAQSGNIITLSSKIHNDTICLEDVSILINKNLTIRAAPGTVVAVRSDSQNPAFRIQAGFNVTLEGFEIIGSETNEASLINQGNLILRDMKIGRKPSNSSSVTVRNDGGTITVQGNTILQE